MTAFVRFAVLSVLLACSADGKPWDLESYELCRHERLADIPNEASGVTYSQVTNSLWVITRRPPAVFEYSLSGKKLRQVSHRGLRDPEGITWMYGYTFAVSQEGGGIAAITIMDIVPWERSVQVRRKLVLRDVRCENNFCFEGVTYDVYKNVFYAVQEMSPMKVWMVTPSGRATELLKGQTKFPGMRDLAGIYYDPLDSRLFVLSQTEQKVAELSWDGEIEQIIPVYDNVVEGLTFTPDGKLMFNVGEPNDLWIYTSTGSCDWEPKGAPPKVILQNYDDDDDTSDSRSTNGGFCSFRSCRGGRQGSNWCNSGTESCVRGCGGTWCWHDSIGKPINKDDLRPQPPMPPPPSPPPKAPPVPPERQGFCTYGDCEGGRQGDVWCSSSRMACTLGCMGTYCWADTRKPRQGFCTYGTCDDGPSGDPWCASSAQSCTVGCKGTFCWGDNLDRPLTAADFPVKKSPPPAPVWWTKPPPKPPAPPRPPGPVWWTRPAPKPSPSPKPQSPPPTSATRGSADRQSGGALSGSMTPNSPSPSRQPSPSQEPQSSPPPTSDKRPSADEWESGGAPSGSVPPGSSSPSPSPDQESPPSTSDTRNFADEWESGALSGSVPQDLQPPASDASPGEIQIEMSDASFNDGYSALVTVGLHGISAADFTPFRQLVFREAIAKITYGDSSGFLEVVFNSSAVDERNAVFSGILSIPEFNSEVGIINDLISGMGRRRRLQQHHGSRRSLTQSGTAFLDQESKAMNDVLPLTAHLLGETLEHAHLLANKTRDAVVSGELQEALFDSGFDHPLYGIEMISMHMEDNGVAPQYYPAKQFMENPADLPNVSYVEDFKEVEVKVLDEAEFEAYIRGDGNSLNTIIIAGGAGIGAIAILAIVVTAVCIRMRSSRKSPSSSAAVRSNRAASVRQSMAAAAGAVESLADKMRKSMDVTSSAPDAVVAGISSSDVQMSIMASGSGHQDAGKPPKHTRQLSGAGLLAFQDAYTPTATPGHSRPGSYLPEGNFMETMLAAAAAEAADAQSEADGAKTPPSEPAPSSRGPNMVLSPSRTDLLGINEDSACDED